MYVGRLGELSGAVPTGEALYRALVKHLNWTLVAYAPEAGPFDSAHIAQLMAVSNNRNVLLQRSDVISSAVAKYVSAPIDPIFLKTVAVDSRVSETKAAKLIRGKRAAISVTWQRTGLTWEKALLIVGFAIAGGYLGVASAGGAATGTAGAATGTAGAATGTAGASAALVAPSALTPIVGTLLPEIIITAAPLSTTAYLVAGAAAAGAGVAAAGAFSTAPTAIPSVPITSPYPLDEVVITATPLQANVLPSVLLPSAAVIIPPFTAPGASPYGTDFGLPQEPPPTLTEELIEVAKKYAIQYGKDQAVAYVQAEMQRKLLAAEEARLRAEIDRMNREMQAVSRDGVQAGAANGKIGLTVAALVALWALKG